MSTPILRFSLLDQQLSLLHFVTTRQEGVSPAPYQSMNLSPYVGDTDIHLAANRLRIEQFIGMKPERWILPFQQHGTKIIRITPQLASLNDTKLAEHLSGVDALVTDLPNLLIGVTTADCTPILLFDPRHRAIGAVHAGWRGTVGHILRTTIQTMKEQWNTRPEELIVAIGPCISQEAFEVGDEVYDAFNHAGYPTQSIASRIDDRWHIDLCGAHLYELKRQGVPADQIEVSGLCSYTSPELLFSARREGIRSGRTLSAIMLYKTD